MEQIKPSLINKPTMRSIQDIKFRGKRVDNGEWVYGFVSQSIPETSETYIMPLQIYNAYEIVNGKKFSLRFENYNQVLPETIGQYTGLSDVLKIQAFDGDIIERSASNGNGKVTGLIEFTNGAFVVKWFNSNKGWNDILRLHLFESKIIGNIHENPELLKK